MRARDHSVRSSISGRFPDSASNALSEGRASLVTSFGCFKYMSLYSAIQFVGPDLTAKSVSGDAIARIFSQGVAAGGYYSKSAFTVEIRVAAPGQINPRGVACAVG